MLKEFNNISGKNVSRLVIISSALACVYSPLLLADYGIDQARLESVDTSKWRCRFCPDEEGMSGSVEGFFGYSDEGIAQRFKNTEAEGEQGQLSVSADLLSNTENDQTTYRLEGIGDDNARAAVAYNDYEDLRADVSFTRTNHYFGEDARTLYPNPTKDTLNLPPAWVNQTTTSAMDFSSLYAVNNYRQRETLETTVRNRFGEDAWELLVNFRQQQRSGTGWTSGSILNDITALPSNRNDQLRELTLNAAVPFQYRDGAGRFGLEYFRSVYDNDVQSLSWENPFTPAITGADQGQLAAAPDSLFRSWRIFANYNWAQHRIDLSYSQGKGEQDQDYLPYTTNSLLVTQLLPADSYDGEVETRNARLRWDYRINAQWQLKTGYRFNERDNVSDRLSYEPVMSDSLLQGLVENQRYSHKKSELDINLDWRVRTQTRFGYAYEYQRFSRDKESSGEYDAQGLSFYWSERWTSNLKTRAKLGAEERDENNHQVVPGDNPLFRDFTVADRLRNQAQMDLDWQCAENVQFSANAMLNEDDFENTLIGVTESEEKSLGLNLNWQVNKNLSTNAAVQRSWLSWMMAGSSQQSFPSWSSTQDDQYDVFTLGVRQAGLVNNTVTVGVNYSYITSEAETQLGSSNEYASQDSDGHTLLTYLSYQWRPEWTLRVETLYERYQSENPSLLALSTLPRVIGNAIQDDNYSNWLVGLRLKYQIPE